MNTETTETIEEFIPNKPFLVQNINFLSASELMEEVQKRDFLIGSLYEQVEEGKNQYEFSSEKMYIQYKKYLLLNTLYFISIFTLFLLLEGGS
ncbi:MAG: hypothetical protein KME15_16385 [Drouetiella hepatica Uher 2000/2452]|jgi:hypothetical protein|uniref:Uncharacterized protein n=1 Tax=Drouetiella hepatica Uher 2000/2452 TaxID=904376 RepID=A0A951QCY4_9CYAN|nr:hypothetical protein [Drouetiella hepatica Uher 2000/2452]